MEGKINSGSSIMAAEGEGLQARVFVKMRKIETGNMSECEE